MWNIIKSIIMENLGKEIIEVVISYSSEIIVFVGTSIAALIKRKLDLRKIKRAEKKRVRDL